MDYRGGYSDPYFDEYYQSYDGEFYYDFPINGGGGGGVTPSPIALAVGGGGAASSGGCPRNVSVGYFLFIHKSFKIGSLDFFFIFVI